MLSVSSANLRSLGGHTIGFCSCGIWAIEHLKPQAALIQTWSGNEPWTQDMADLSFARAMSVADTARRNRCVPILVTPAPVFGTNPEAEAYRQRNLTRARASAQHRGYLLDLDALWGTGATPNTYRRDYDWGDQMHPNDKACAAAWRRSPAGSAGARAWCAGRSGWVSRFAGMPSNALEFDAIFRRV